MDEFTKAERARLDYLYGNDFNGEVSPDDIKLISKFERYLTIQEIQQEQNKKESLDDIRNMNSEAQEAYAQAMNNLNELHARAMARLDRFEHGK